MSARVNLVEHNLDDLYVCHPGHKRSTCRYCQDDKSVDGRTLLTRAGLVVGAFLFSVALGMTVPYNHWVATGLYWTGAALVILCGVVFWRRD